MRLFTILFMLFLCTASCFAQSPTEMILVVGDLNRSDATVLESKLRERLRSLRDQGYITQKISSYNFALRDHSKALSRLGLKRDQSPILAVCSVNKAGLPEKVLWSETVTTVEEATNHLGDTLGQSYAAGASPKSPNLPQPVVEAPAVPLEISDLAVSQGNVFGVLNVKVRMKNPNTSTVRGPIQVKVAIKTDQGTFQDIAEQSVEKFPAGWTVTRDFVQHDANSQAKPPFTVRVQVLVPGAPPVEKELLYQGQAPTL
jgi:hypothetical protein